MSSTLKTSLNYIQSVSTQPAAAAKFIRVLRNTKRTKPRKMEGLFVLQKRLETIPESPYDEDLSE